MWISTTYGPGPPSRCRGWWRSIASNAACLQVLGEHGTGIQGGSEMDDRTAHRTHVQIEFAARGHALQHVDVEVEVRCLAPGNRPLVRIVSELRCIDDRQHLRTV